MPQHESKSSRLERAYYVDERVWCSVISRGAYVSLVAYTLNGLGRQVYVENEDLIFKEDEDND